MRSGSPGSVSSRMRRVPRTAPRRLMDTLWTGGRNWFASQGRIRKLSVDRVNPDQNSRSPVFGKRVQAGLLEPKGRVGIGFPGSVTLLAASAALFSCGIRPNYARTTPLLKRLYFFRCGNSPIFFDVPICGLEITLQASLATASRSVSGLNLVYRSFIASEAWPVRTRRTSWETPASARFELKVCRSE